MPSEVRRVAVGRDPVKVPGSGMVGNDNDTVLLINQGTAAVYLGIDATVSTTTGIPLPPLSCITLAAGAGWWFVADAAVDLPQDVHVIPNAGTYTGQPAGGRTRLLYDSGLTPFSSQLVVSPLLSVWPWPTVQIKALAGAAAIEGLVNFYGAPDRSASIEVYDFSLSASGTGYVTVPAAGPFMDIWVQQNAAVSNSYQLYVTATELPVARQPQNVPWYPLASFNGSIGAGVTNTQATLFTWGGEVDIFIYTGAASSDIDVYTTDINGSQTWYYLTRAGGPGTVNLRTQLLPNPLTITMKNNDAASKSFKLSVVAKSN